MRIDAVYVLGPEPQPPSKPNRRAFLLAATAFIGGIGLGGACGYTLGASTSRASTGIDASSVLPSSGDALLDDLRRLAVKAPIEELVQRRVDFVSLVGETYRRDEVLWQGVRRLVDHVVSNPEMDRRRIAARALVQLIEAAEAPFQAHLAPRLDELRTIR
jgi:hypothetical protein